jgi:hypothetical protein
MAPPRRQPPHRQLRQPTAARSARIASASPCAPCCSAHRVLPCPSRCRRCSAGVGHGDAAHAARPHVVAAHRPPVKASQGAGLRAVHRQRPTWLPPHRHVFAPSLLRRRHASTDRVNLVSSQSALALLQKDPYVSRNQPAVQRS